MNEDEAELMLLPAEIAHAEALRELEQKETDMLCTEHTTYNPKCAFCLAHALVAFDDAERSATAIPGELEA